MKKRNRIGEYELEWLEPKLDVHPKAAARIEGYELDKAAARIEGLKRVLIQTVLYIL